MGIPGRLRRRGLTMAIVFTSLATTLSMFAAAPASAAVAPTIQPIVHVTPGSGGTPTRFTITMPRPTRVGGHGPQDGVVINCSGGIAGPGFSDVGNVRVAGFGSCSSPIVNMELTINLTMNGSLPWGQGSDSNPQFVAGVADGPCIPGSSFSGSMRVFMEFGPDFVPPEATANVSTPFVNFPDC